MSTRFALVVVIATIAAFGISCHRSANGEMSSVLSCKDNIRTDRSVRFCRQSRSVRIVIAKFLIVVALLAHECALGCSGHGDYPVHGIRRLLRALAYRGTVPVNDSWQHAGAGVGCRYIWS